MDVETTPRGAGTDLVEGMVLGGAAVEDRETDSRSAPAARILARTVASAWKESESAWTGSKIAWIG